MQDGQGWRSALSAEPDSPSRPSSSTRGRKPKTHVASACVNCKRAHLSCDVQRPCARCVAAGKQDTCFDVQHKKRGRPRLREDAFFEPHSERTHTHRNTTTTDPGVGPSSAQISLRVGSDDASTAREKMTPSQHVAGRWNSSLPSLVPPSPASLRRLTINPRPNQDLPAAYLDLDLRLIKVNPTFDSTIFNSRSVRGVLLSDLFTPADRVSFQTIKSRLREEREARDPIYMPPILTEGHDLMPQITETEIDFCTAGYGESIHLWTRLRADGTSQGYKTSLRLAKSRTYFAVLRVLEAHPLNIVPHASSDSMIATRTAGDASTVSPRGLHREMPHSVRSDSIRVPSSADGAEGNRQRSYVIRNAATRRDMASYSYGPASVPSTPIPRTMPSVMQSHTPTSPSSTRSFVSWSSDASMVPHELKQTRVLPAVLIPTHAGGPQSSQSVSPLLADPSGSSIGADQKNAPHKRARLSINDMLQKTEGG